MTIRNTIMTIMSLIGVGLILALLNSGALVTTQGIWYAVGILMALGGIIPREMAYLLGGTGIIVIAGPFFNAGESLGGIGVPCGFFCLALGGIFYVLSLRCVVRLWKCRRCFWKGPRTALRFGRCPQCSSYNVNSTERSILLGG